MPIQPIDHLLMVPRNQEASQVKQQEVAHAPQEQSFLAGQLQHQVMQQSQRTVRADETENKEERYDAKEKGKGQYERNKKDRKKQEEEEKVLRQRAGEGGSVLDIKI